MLDNVSLKGYIYSMSLQTKLFLIIIAIVFLFGGAVGYFLGDKYKKCPSVTESHSDTSSASVLSKDTTIIYDTVPKIVQKIVPHYIRDTIHDTVGIHSPTFDTTTCYTLIDKLQSDSAYTKVEVCSDSLPKNKPKDWQTTFTYVPAPLKVKTITNTVTITKPEPVKFWDWKMYCLVILGAGAAGYAAANH